MFLLIDREGPWIQSFVHQYVFEQIVGMGFEYFWVLGWLTLALWAYLIRLPFSFSLFNFLTLIASSARGSVCTHVSILIHISSTQFFFIHCHFFRDWRDLVFYTSLPSIVSVVLVRIKTCMLGSLNVLLFFIKYSWNVITHFSDLVGSWKSEMACGEGEARGSWRSGWYFPHYSTKTHTNTKTKTKTKTDQEEATGS